VSAAPALRALPWDEARRLAALRGTGILDRARDPAFDGIARIAALTCGTPIGVVNFIEDTRQFFMAETGLGVRGTALDVSICVEAILSPGLTVVPDLASDPRFACNPLVAGEPKLRFYAGVRLDTPDGLPLGTLCVLDYAPRPEGLTAEQAEVLAALGRQVMSLLTLVRQENDRRESERALRAREAELARVQRIGQVGGLEVDLRHGFHNRRSPEYLRIHGLGQDDANESHESWVRRIHPDDRARVTAHFYAAVGGTGTDYEAEYRIVRPSDGAVRWILAKAEIERDARGAPVRLVGAHIDITERKLAEEARELLSQELSHRIKNIFTVVGGLVALSARSEDAPPGFVAAVRSRIGALAQAHEYVRPGDHDRPEATLHGLIRALLAPYGRDAEPRFALSGDDVPIGPKAGTALALVLHEQATNAAKYGALACDGGVVEIESRRDGERVLLAWRERGGPPLAGPPERRGFGSVMTERSVAGQLGGSISSAWAPDGLRIELVLSAARLAR
jgi:PAS domain S-box-containing protein